MDLTRQKQNKRYKPVSVELKWTFGSTKVHFAATKLCATNPESRQEPTGLRVTLLSINDVTIILFTRMQVRRSDGSWSDRQTTTLLPRLTRVHDCICYLANHTTCLSRRKWLSKEKKLIKPYKCFQSHSQGHIQNVVRMQHANTSWLMTHSLF